MLVMGAVLQEYVENVEVMRCGFDVELILFPKEKEKNLFSTSGYYSRCDIGGIEEIKLNRLVLAPINLSTILSTLPSKIV